MSATILVTAADRARYAGALTDEQHVQFTSFVQTLSTPQQDELTKLAAINWQTILGMLPALLALIPGLGPFSAIITAIFPFIQALISGGSSVPDGGIPKPA